MAGHRSAKGLRSKRYGDVIMFQPRHKPTAATPLVVLMAIIFSGGGPPVTACACPGSSAQRSTSNCCRVQRCGCQKSSAPTVCCCRKSDPNIPRSSVPTGQDLRVDKSVLWFEVPVGEQQSASQEWAYLSPSRCFSLTFQRSFQSLLCIWRI